MGLLKSRTRVCRHCGDLHEVGRWPDNCRDDGWPRSDYPSPAVIGDGLPGGVNGLYHHAALRQFDSKSEYRRATRAFGCTELGNEKDAAMKEIYHAPSDREIEAAVAGALREVQVDDGKGDDSVSVIDGP